MDVREDLQAVIAEAYDVFSEYTLARGLTVCNCNVCMSKEAEFALLRTPLRDISHELLAEYTNSAHGYDDESIADELRYFLPRYFELIALGTPPDYLGLEQCLRRLGESSYHGKWPAAEVEVIDRFFDVFLAASTQRPELELELASALTMALTAGAKIERLIQVLESAPDPAAAVHLAVMRGEVIREDAGFIFDSAYLREQYREAAQTLGNWLVGPAVGQRLEAAFYAVTDPRLQEILSKAAW